MFVLKSLSPDLDLAFDNLLASRFRKAEFDESGFRRAAHEWFDARTQTHNGNVDPFFDNFTPYGLPWQDAQRGNMELWEFAVEIAVTWEEAHPGQRLHKGTGYYFAGVRSIELGDIERGFLYMHRAVEEDRRSTGSDFPARPAFWFVTLDPRDPHQAYHTKVTEFEQYVRQHLRAYRGSRRGRLTLDRIRQRVIRAPKLLDVMATIGHCTARVLRMREVTAVTGASGTFATSLLSQLVLETCFVIEALVVPKVKLTPSQPRLPENVREVLLRYPSGHGISFPQRKFDALAKEVKRDVEATIQSLLTSRQVPGVPTLTKRESDLAVFYAIRNKSAHALARPQATSKYFDDIIRRLFFAVFAAMEGLYR